VKESSPAVVLVETLDASGNPVAQGSGFIVSADGRIITNYHVVQGANSAIVKMSNGAFFPVEGVLADSESDDLVALKVPGSGLPVLRLADTKSVSAGERVIAIGSPLGLEGTVTDGIVSAIREESETNTPLIQTSAPISHGSSGGPLLDLSGRVVGILTFKFSSGENLNFAVEVSALKALLASAHSPTSMANSKFPAAKPQDVEVTKPGSANPTDQADAHASLGSALAQEGDTDGAIAEYRAAIRLNPKNVGVRRSLAAALRLKGDLDGAIAQYRAVLRLEPSDQVTRWQLGTALEQKHDFDGEIAEAHEALRMNPDDKPAVQNLCMGYLMQGYWEGLKWQFPLEPMIDDLKEVVRLGPNNDYAHYQLGTMLEKTHNRKEAFEEYRAAYKLKPENPDYQKAYERLLKHVKQ
jgi:Flp pilus assembly protein TadD